MTLGKTIQELRRQKNVTQEELAAELGVTAAAVSKWENGYTLPDILMLCALADFFQVTTDELLGRKQEEKYAFIAAKDAVLSRQIQDIAVDHGLTIVKACKSYDEALGDAIKHGGMRYILTSCGEPLTQEQCKRQN